MKSSILLSAVATVDPAHTNIVRGLWLAIVALSLTICALGAPYRVAELSEPCAVEADCLRDQYSPAEFEAVSSYLPVSQVFWTMEALLGVLILGCLWCAWLLFWRQRPQWIGVIASLFIVLVPVETTSNSDALGRAFPQLDWLTQSTQAFTDIIVAALFLLFPTGRFVSRVTAWFLAAWAAFVIVLRLGPSQVRLPELQDGLPVFFLLIVGFAIMVYRYRSAVDAVERQQFKWVFVALAGQGLVFVFALLFNYVVPPDYASDLLGPLQRAFFLLAYMASLALFPFALLSSILRHRLWDVDLLIHRSLTYGFLTAILVPIVALLVAALQSLSTLVFGAEYRTTAVAVSMAAAGACFQPLRRALRRFVDRFFFGIAVEYQAGKQALPVPDAVGNLANLEGLRDYVEWELIGLGGMAQVYRARHATEGHYAAIKILTKEKPGDELEARFRREAKILAQLDHPNIVKLLSYEKDGDKVRVIVMEYISETDLAQHLHAFRQEQDVDEEAGLPQQQVLDILDEVVEALDYVHAVGVVHRDLKPSNVLVAADDVDRKVVLTDFGIAKAPKVAAGTQVTRVGTQVTLVEGSRSTSDTRLTSAQVIGTVAHMSPEQIRDPANVDYRSDIYSLGVLAYQLLTGRTPFEGANATAVLIAHLQQPPPDPRRLVPDLPEYIVSAVWQALSKRPHARQKSAREFLAALKGQQGAQAPTVVA